MKRALHLPDIEDTALEQAAEWYAVLRSEGAQQADHAEWQIWLRADPAHQAAWAEVESIDASFKGLIESQTSQAAKSALLESASHSRRQMLKLLGFAGTAIISGWMVKRYSPWRDWLTDVTATHEQYQVDIGQTRLFTLVEGSKLWLNTNSQADVSYSLALRRITLRKGELLVATAKESATFYRPLVVDTPHGRITAIGTRFTVRLDEYTTHVAVYEGAVSIEADKSGQIQGLKAGEQFEFDAQTLKAVQPAEKAREAWTRGILLVDDRRLDDFVRELSRYRTGQLTVAPEVAHLRIMGAFPLNNTDLILTSLTVTLPVSLKQVSSTELQLIKK
ncbi:MAG: FecR domain-containing protein [Methylophilus sp.]|uniref:FecR domain-containing protein n=1 Tax=Methylophilus sp. TaxID=29541 RepID=UPI003F9EC49B